MLVLPRISERERREEADRKRETAPPDTHTLLSHSDPGVMLNDPDTERHLAR